MALAVPLMSDSSVTHTNNTVNGAYEYVCYQFSLVIYKV